MSVAVAPSPIVNLDGGATSSLSTPKKEPSTTMTTTSPPTTKSQQTSSTPQTAPESPSRNSITASSPPSTANKRRSTKKKISQPGFLGVIAQALHPTACLKACHGEVLDETHEKPYHGVKLDEAMNDVITGLVTECNDDEARFAALEALHVLVDKDHAYNRIPVVCNSEWNIIHVLTKTLQNCQDDLDERRLICLILNNLSIPFDNKAVMVLGPSGTALIDVLLDTISTGNPETYLCCVCLMNLSILEDSKNVLTSFIPSSITSNDDTDGKDVIKKNNSSLDSTDPLKNPRSLLRTLEHMIGLYSTILTSSSSTQNGVAAAAAPVISVESQAVLWAMGLFRNLATRRENAIIISQTTIPSIAGSCISNSVNPLCKWTRDSLEDMCLGFLVCLVQSNESIKILKKNHKGLIDSLQSIVGEPGIHGMRASLISKQLQPQHNLAEI